MIRFSFFAAFLIAALLPLYRIQTPDQAAGNSEELWRHRNLGKAYYENPTTHEEAVKELGAAVDLAPDSLLEHLNYGLALLRVGKDLDLAIQEFQKAERLEEAQAPKGSRLLHIPFGLGMAFKKKAETSGLLSDKQKAIEQLETVVRFEPDEPMANYNLGVLYQELDEDLDRALPRYEAAAKHSDLPDPHFRLKNAYHELNRTEDESRENQIWERNRGNGSPEATEWSFYREIYDPIEPPYIGNTTSPALQLQETNLPLAIDPATAGLSVIDVDADGRPDLLVWSKRGIAIFERGAALYPNSGLEGIKDVLDVAPGDFNNDGFADLFILTRTDAALFVNINGRFRRFDCTLPHGLRGKAIWVNYDHDNDLDLLLFGETPVLLQNAGHSGFIDRTPEFPFIKGQAASAVLFGADPYNSASDIVVAYRDRSAVLYRDNFGGKYEPLTLNSLPSGTTSLVAQDVNQDGLIDLLASSPASSVLLLNHDGRLDVPPIPLPGAGVLAVADLEGRGVMDLVASDGIYRNSGSGNFARDTRAPIPSSVAALEASFDPGYRTQVVVVDEDGHLHKILGRSTKRRWIEVSLSGKKNLKLAPGALVEVKAGQFYQKRIYNGVPLFFGLSGYRTIDTIRIQWPNGLFQNEVNLTAGLGGKRYNFSEAQRLSGSCPMIFTWNGHEFEFITDVLGVAPLGASAGDGQYFPVDDDEYIQIRGESLVPIDGKYEVRITEELHEVSYLDKVQLIALDHPRDLEIFTNDKFKGPPFPEFRLFGSRRRTYPKSAHQLNEPNGNKTSGNDVLARLRKRDRTYPDGYRRDYNGVAEMHYLDLDFGSVTPDNRAVLILSGWVDWADGSTFLGAAQEKNRELVLPYLQVKNAKGEWETVIEDMGIPAGKPKTIAVDLEGKFKTGSREIRIGTNLCVYWDEIFLIDGNEIPGDDPRYINLTEIRAEAADLHFRGFSKLTVDPQRKQPESFNYAQTSLAPAWNWNPTPGTYTRYGDVLALVNDGEPDDRFIIMGSGDELRLLFSAEGLPALPAGWTRDFLLLVVGWAKDGDYNTAHSQTVEPLPFHKMSAYPYSKSERYPDDQLHRDYIKQYNTRPAVRLLPTLPQKP